MNKPEPTQEELRALVLSLMLCGPYFTDEQWRACCATLRPEDENPCDHFYLTVFCADRPLARTGYKPIGWTGGTKGSILTEEGKRYVE